jgi:hypothetical protein
METVVPLFNVSLTKAGGLGRCDLSACPHAVNADNTINERKIDFMIIVFMISYKNIKKLRFSGYRSSHFSNSALSL